MLDTRKQKTMTRRRGGGRGDESRGRDEEEQAPRPGWGRKPGTEARGEASGGGTDHDVTRVRQGRRQGWDRMQEERAHGQVASTSQAILSRERLNSRCQTAGRRHGGDASDRPSDGPRRRSREGGPSQEGPRLWQVVGNGAGCGCADTAGPRTEGKGQGDNSRNSPVRAPLNLSLAQNPHQGSKAPVRGWWGWPPPSTTAASVLHGNVTEGGAP